MSGLPIPLELSISMERACALSVQCWRLRRLSEVTKDTTAKSGLRHAVRHVSETLEALGIEVIDFTGRAYDPGMVPEVVEVRHDQTLTDGQTVVDETVVPTITWRGQVVSAGQIIVRRSAASPEPNEVLK